VLVLLLSTTGTLACTITLLQEVRLLLLLLLASKVHHNQLSSALLALLAVLGLRTRAASPVLQSTQSASSLPAAAPPGSPHTS
jgi:hypothetical protein